MLLHAGEGGVGLKEDALGHDDGRLAAGLEGLHEVLQEEQFGGVALDREVLLDLRVLFAAEGRVGENHVVAVLLLNVADVLGERVASIQVGAFDAVQDHIHHAHHVSQRGLFEAEEAVFHHEIPLIGGELLARLFDVLKGIDQEAARARGGVVDRLSRFGVDYFDDGTNHGARGVELACVAASVAHVLQQAFIHLRELEEFGVGLEIERVDDVEHLAQGVPRGDLVIEVGESRADLVSHRADVLRVVIELTQVGEELAVDVGSQVVARLGLQVINLLAGILGAGPSAPAVVVVECRRVVRAGEDGCVGLFVFVVVEEFEKENPRSLLGVVHGTRDAIVTPEDVGDAVNFLL